MSSENIIKLKKMQSPVSFDFNKLCFPSQPKDTFRVRASTDSEGVMLWVESVNTKQQWQATVRKISDCGPSGIPDHVVYTLLEKALQGLNQANVRSHDDPEIDLTNSDKGVMLTLQLVFGGVWRPEFVFTLLPVALEKLALLEARLRDAHDEIEVLRAGFTASYLSIDAKTSCAQGGAVQWDGDDPTVSASHFKLSEDLTQVTILRKGVYQVNVRLKGPNGERGWNAALQLNGTTCFQGDVSQNTVQIHEIVKLSVNDVLQVCSGGSSSRVNQAANRFTVLFLGN